MMYICIHEAEGGLSGGLLVDTRHLDCPHRNPCSPCEKKAPWDPARLSKF